MVVKLRKSVSEYEKERERRDTLAKLDLLTLICLQIKVACEALGLCTTGGGG
jgi:hypothetical protein